MTVTLAPVGHSFTGLTERLPTLHAVEQTAEKVGLSVQRINDLAEAGYMPHWRIDGGPPMFVTSEVKEWVTKNLVTRCEGSALPTKIFLIADRAAADRRILPNVLRDVPELRDISDVVLLRSGIYFLCHYGRVVYVGQAAVAARRIAEHVPTKDFDQVFFLPWPRWDLDQIEGAFIRLLQPPLNKNQNGTLVSRGDPARDAEVLQALNPPARQLPPNEPPSETTEPGARPGPAQEILSTTSVPPLEAAQGELYGT